MNIKTSLLLVSPALFLLGCGGGAPKPAATADAAVMQVIDSLEKNDPSAFWHMLPESYQTQANDVLHDFAEKVPDNLYNQGAGLVKKLEEVLSTKKDLLLENSMVQQSPVDVSANYDQIVALLGAITSSNLKSVETLKTADIGKLMGDIGGKFMQTAANMELDQSPASTREMKEMLEFKDKLSTFNAELVSEEGDTATVRISMEGEEPEEMDFVRIEGKWLPKEMAEGWSEMIADAKAGVAGMNIDPQTASQMQMGMTMADSVLDQLLNAETQEDLQQVIGGLIGMAGGM